MAQKNKLQSRKKTNKQKSKDDSNYVVKKGDTLYSISKKYNTPIDEIKKKNKLKNDQLNVGQRLKI